MSSLQKLPTLSTTQQISAKSSQKLNPQLYFQNLSESDSETLERPDSKIVNPYLKVKGNTINYDDTEEEQHEEDQDIKRFLEQQIPGLYKVKIKQQKQDQEFQQNNTIPIIYDSSIAPQYFMMSKAQKQNYFDNLNAIYMTRMNPSNLTLKQNEQNNFNATKKKPAIKFNQIVFEVPFSKDQQPIVVKDTPQEEAFIVFDDDAYDNQGDGFLQEQMLQMQKDEIIMNQTSLYFDQMDSDEEEQFLKQQILGRYCKDRLMYTERDDNIYTESDQEEISSSPVSDEEQCSSQGQQEQEDTQKTQKNGTVQVIDEEESSRRWKRNSSRNYINEYSNSQSSQCDVDELFQEKKKRLVNSIGYQKTKQINNALDDQNLQQINGRKINPNSQLQIRIFQQGKQSKIQKQTQNNHLETAIATQQNKQTPSVT